MSSKVKTAFQFYGSSSDTLSHTAIKLIKPLFEYSSNARAQDLITKAYNLPLCYPMMVALLKVILSLPFPKLVYVHLSFFRDGKPKDIKI